MKKWSTIGFLAILFAVLGWLSLTARQGGGRIPYAPTADDALPSSVLGKAPALRGESVQYWGEDSKTVGYLALPDGDGPFGAVILIHEWNGLGDRVRQVADSLAAEGYVALAADLFSGRTGSNRQENMALTREANGNPRKIIDNLDAAARFLRSRSDVTGKVAAMGWCFGGGVALSYALGGEHHDGTAIFYGRLLQDPEELKRIHHEVYGTFAANDRGIPPDQVNGFVAALRKAGVANDVHIYDEVGHGFWLHVDRNPDVAAKPALDAWQRLKAYLRRTVSQ